jgi:hypothetical protein
MENNHFQWVNPLFLWPFSMAMLVIARGYQQTISDHPIPSLLSFFSFSSRTTSSLGSTE